MIEDMKATKATGSSGITTERLKILDRVDHSLFICIVNQVIKVGAIPMTALKALYSAVSSVWEIS